MVVLGFFAARTVLHWKAEKIRERYANEIGRRRSRLGGSNSVVESQPSKLLVAGSIPVSRSRGLK